MAICANVYDADGWNIFVCSEKEGHSGLHGEAVMSGLSQDDHETYVLAVWPDNAGNVPAWYEVRSGDTYVAPVPFNPLTLV